jgi:hypothetical protein
MDNDEWDDDHPLEDWEYPDEDDAEEQSTTTVCPNCRAEMYDDTAQCPHCGEYLTREHFAMSRFPPWVYAGAVIALIGILASLFYIC